MERTIYEATAQDAQEILEFTRRIGAQTDNLTYGAEGIGSTLEGEQAFLQACAESNNSLFLVARQESRIVGTANLSGFSRARLSHRAEIGIAVDRQVWGQGIGRQMMETLISFAKKNGVRILSLEVRSDNARAIHLYESFGFVRYGTFPGFFEIDGKLIDFDCMVLQLQ